MGGFDGKVIVVCAGGTSDMFPGMGSTTARRVAAGGGSVVIGDLDEEAAQRTAQLITEAGGTAVGQRYDAGDDDQTKALIDRALAEYGGVDGIHFNACDTGNVSMADGQHDAVTIPLDIWQRQLDVTLRGFLLAARHAIPPMLERGGGGIVGTSSAAAYLGDPVRVAYATAKAGLGAIVRHIASRWGSEGIRANTIAPGMVPSEAMRAHVQLDATPEKLHPRSTRVGVPADIAAMVTLLLSDEGAWVNGQCISVDGGLVMRP